jgi:hypothetical protein
MEFAALETWHPKGTPCVFGGLGFGGTTGRGQAFFAVAALLKA